MSTILLRRAASSKRAPELWTLFDNGAVSGVKFLPNALTRSGNYDKNECVMQSAGMRCRVSSGTQTSSYNGHFVTDIAVRIPKGATKLCMKVSCPTSGIGFNDTNSVQLGIIAKDATMASNFSYVVRTNCTGTEYGGVSKAKTVSGNISAHAGEEWKIMIYTNQKPLSSSYRETYFNKVWFE